MTNTVHISHGSSNQFFCEKPAEPGDLFVSRLGAVPDKNKLCELCITMVFSHARHLLLPQGSVWVYTVASAEPTTGKVTIDPKNVELWTAKKWT